SMLERRTRRDERSTRREERSTRREERSGVAFCIASLPQYQTPVRATAPFVYIRFHGSGEMYYYNYTPDELRHWGDVITRFAAEGREVYAYFNNDPNAWAVSNALELSRLLVEST